MYFLPLLVTYIALQKVRGRHLELQFTITSLVNKFDRVHSCSLLLTSLRLRRIGCQAGFQSGLQRPPTAHLPPRWSIRLRSTWCSFSDPRDSSPGISANLPSNIVASRRPIGTMSHFLSFKMFTRRSDSSSSSPDAQIMIFTLLPPLRQLTTWRANTAPPCRRTWNFFLNISRTHVRQLTHLITCKRRLHSACRPLLPSHAKHNSPLLFLLPISKGW